MRTLILLTAMFFYQNANSQHRINKFSASILSNLYSYGEGQGSLNNVVRLSEGLAFTFKTYDTVKKHKGMIYEFTANTTTAYYKNIIGNNSVLEVNDLHTNINLIFPMFIFYKKDIEHCFGIGIGIGTLAGRDYLDENNNFLPYNSTNLKDIKFGKYWTSSFMLDYELDLKFSKRLGLNLGLRYTTETPVHSGNTQYVITQGTGLSFKYGIFYQFK